FQPEPDFLLIARKDFDKSSHPTTADLMIEVADSSLVYDRNDKASLYALAGIQDYWIVNLINHTTEVRREPSVDKRAKYGYAYKLLSRLKPDESVAPLFRPNRTVPVATWF
ncbi:MAG: Uma2 family endonuclease, partial [Candidatus Xenobia bacterium]